MISYVELLTFTDKGLQSVRDTTKRAAEARQHAKKQGVNIREILWTTGEFDLVCIVEAEDEASLAAFNLAVSMQGHVRTRSLRAYTSDEMDNILAKLP